MPRRLRPPPPADAAGAPPLRGSVVFVHGLWLSGAESFLLRRRLAEQGWRLHALPFSSVNEPPARTVRRAARYARMLARRTDRPVHLLGHSLGGLIIYRMFEEGLLAPDRFSGDFCRVVFLGTPSAGTRSGRALARWSYGRRMLGQGGVELLDAREREWRWSAQLGVIAGTRPHGLGRLLADLGGPNDGTVAVAETRLRGAHAACELPVSHTGMMVSAEVAREVAHFLDCGSFLTAPARG